MTFATLRAIHNIVGEALDDIERVYHAHGRDAIFSSDSPEGIYGDFAAQPPSTATHPNPPRVPDAHPMPSSSRKAYVSPPPSPSVATSPNLPRHHQRRSPEAEAELDFPSLDEPCDPNSQAEMLTSDPRVLGAINRVIAGCGQMTAMVQNPFLTICDSTMGVCWS